MIKNNIKHSGFRLQASGFRLRRSGGNRVAAAVVACAVAAGGAAGCGEKAATAKKADDYAIPVAVETVKKGAVRDVVSVTGNIAPEKMVTLFSNVPGALTSLKVKEGDRVRKGQLVAVVDREKAGFQAQQARAGLEMARANLKNMEANYRRLEKLHKEGAVAQKLWDDMQTGYLAAKSQVDQLEGTVGLADSQLKDAVIVATMAGVIAKKHIDAGEVVTSAQMMKAAPIVTIVDMDRVKVLIGIVEKDIARVKAGLEAEVRLDAYRDRVFSGRVTNVAPIVNPHNRTTEVEVMLENADGLIKPGMFARVAIIVVTRENAVLLPQDAVIESESGRNVFVVEGGRSARRNVTTGFLDGTVYEVLSGLSGGESLVVVGQQRLKDGAPVKAQPAGGGR
ncbi:MAG: efflux RND transporter periplasmic adaptor subunit [Deltaproteobacteria bacterium]|nr:efflux RND transporter periplasmic adaptor subunit [Deltaproteobacteria bacterium]